MLLVVSKSFRVGVARIIKRGASDGAVQKATHTPQQTTVVASGKLPARAPLMKNCFLGIVDKELLGFPEPISRDDLAKLKNELLPFKDFYSTEVDGRAIDATRSIAPKLLENLKQLGSYGTNVPVAFDGKGWGWTESLYASETETCMDLAMGLISHRVIIDLLCEKGTAQQQQQYLPKLATGALVATEAIYEFNQPEDGHFSTKADYDATSQLWTLSGHKSFVVTGPLAPGSVPLFLVIAETKRPNMKGDRSRATTIFLVESTTPGVKLAEQHLTLGCRGLESRHVHFDAVQVPERCIIGEAHAGDAVANVLLRSERLRTSQIAMGHSRKMLNELALYSKETKQFGVPLKDLDMTKAHLSRAMCATYAMESMLYMTAGMLDEFDQQDVTLEAALVKYFALTRSLQFATECVDIVGPKALHSGEETELNFRNAAQISTYGESADTLRIYIALTGLQYAGVHTNEMVRKSRNPLFHPAHILGKYLQTANIDDPKTKMKLGEHLHPTLEPAAQCIEHSVARLQMCTDLLFTHYGNQIVERHTEMQRLAEMATTIYSMFSSAARASRSYCIGLSLADHELLTATTICADGRHHVYTLCKEIFAGHYANNDYNMQRLAQNVIKGGYCAAHPLTFNF